jgi:hypothetical protein
MSFQINNQSIFDEPADAFVNTINCVGAMGAGIALEFKKRYPEMFADYQIQCKKKLIRPGDCYGYYDKDHGIYLLGLAVKNDWHYWSTLEWLESSLKSLKLFILENDIKSVNMPLPGGKNGRRGPFGKVPGLTPTPANREDLKFIVRRDLEKFADKFAVDIRLCIPEEAPKRKELDLSAFLEAI